MCHRRPWKALLLCLAIAALAAVTTAAALPAHWHSAIGGVNCEICCIAHTPVVQSTVVADVRPPVPVERHVSVERLPGLLETFSFADLGRAPPAWLLARG
jgi:hypothetical protein